jgi:hypothetical protein
MLPTRGKNVKYGMCARCTKRLDCKFRQQGTWVVECEFFKEDPKAKPINSAYDRTQRADVRREMRLA